MHQHYRGLPAAPSVEQAILAAQLLILKDLQTGRRAAPARRTEGTFSESPAFLRL
jgi:hypothetical protein